MLVLSNDEILSFVRESNRIEGILREPTKEELVATEDFLAIPTIRTEDLVDFVSVCAPGARLRTQSGVHVRVGNHFAPRGGPGIAYALLELLQRANDAASSPYEVHVAYENLHPFTDGNGRSGRVLWSWTMLRREDKLLKLGFLHAWYYQSLEASDTRARRDSREVQGGEK